MSVLDKLQSNINLAFKLLEGRGGEDFHSPIVPHVTPEQEREIRRRILEITTYLGLPEPEITIVGSRARILPLGAGYHDVDVLLLFNPREVERMTTYHGWYAQEGQIKEAIEDILKFKKMSYVDKMEIDVFVTWK